MAARIDREELRQLIREALREALGQPSPPRSGVFRTTTDMMLNSGTPEFSRERVATKQLGEGQWLPSTSKSGDAPPPAPPHKGEGRGAYRFESGVLTEAKIAEIGRTHSRILVGSSAVLTPLARDKAREMKLEIVRQGP